MKKVLLIHPTIQPCGVDLLKSDTEVILAPDGREETLISHLSAPHIGGMIVRVEKITRRVIEASKDLQVIGQHGVGVDNIDVAAATQKGILVLNAATSNYVSTAEHAVMLILALARKVLDSDRAVREGDFLFRERFYPMQINGKVLFILGLGRIGSELARKCRLAFNMEILAYDPYVADFEMAGLGVKKVDLETGFAEADFVSIHMALTPETRHLITEKEISLMKPTAILINVSRGGVIKQEDLVKALKDKRIAAAGLDVFDPEPPMMEDPLLKLSNVILSPHFAGDTYEAKQNCSQSIANDVLAVLKGHRPRFVVNPEVFAIRKTG